MCGRYSLFVPPEELESRFDARFERSFTPTYNAAPGQSVPVVTDEAPETIRQLEWGFVPSWADGTSDRLINARAETLAETRAFRSAYVTRSDGGRSGDDALASDRETPARGRCLVLADGFYEWAPTETGNQPYRIAFEDDRPFAMAGLWERREPPSDDSQAGLDAFGGGIETDSDDDRLVETVTIVTMRPNDLVAELHDRMPAIVASDDERRWLRDADPVARLDPHPSDSMVAYPVSTAVNDPSVDDPSVVEPIDGAGRSD
ncbi:SOS response-associated peptidase [Halovivax cerinus]|uniref:SOS response-associated peptidase n=1 Tax=Halovivax cerinus TaxID=1487865 RepID=A0ABD5NLY1_9EURY|nr:SOS response-associated peptidase [Halovivax cerinus]